MLVALIKKELLALCRDIHGLGALFVMPLVFIIVISLALQDVYDPALDSQVYVIVNHDTGQASHTLTERWEKQHGKSHIISDWQHALESGRAKYAIVIDRRFSADLLEPVINKALVKLIADPGWDTGLYRASRAELEALTAQIRSTALIAQLEERAAQTTNKEAPSEATDEATKTIELTASERIGERSSPNAVQYNVPAWLIFGMFFVVAAMSNLFVQEKANGVLTRLLSLGVPNWLLISAKALPYFFINTLQATLMLAVGVWLMPHIARHGLSLTGIDWPALVLMLTATSAAAVSFALAVACLVRTHAQASAIGPIANLLMAAIGGIMVPTFVMPPAMQTVASYSPMNWALQGLLNVLLRGAGPAQIWSYSGQLVAFAVVMLILSGLFFRWRTT